MKPGLCGKKHYMATSGIITGPGREIDSSVFEKHGTVLLESTSPDEADASTFLFKDPAAVIQCTDHKMVQLCIEQVEEATQKGMYAAGFIGYEAADAWIPGNRPDNDPGFPLLWFGLYENTTKFEGPLVLPNPGCSGERIDHSLDTSRDEYVEAVKKVLSHIRDGETYQVNYTTRTRFHWKHGAWQLYLRLRRSQPVPYGAFLNCGNFSVVSLSPELFLVKRGDELKTRPMKGTAPRGKDPDSDRKMAAWLENDPKNRAENLMIVDLMRNDLGRLSEIGKVAVHEPFRVEPYKNLFQMTTGVSCTVRSDFSMPALFEATFPPGSVTGAPKINTMRIISELEKSPRKIYTGAIGAIDPEGGLTMNVAIRTLICSASGKCEMGIGSGIVADSVPEDEFAEVLLKGDFLNTTPYQGADLFETILLKEDGSLLWLQEHLLRMEKSARELGYPFSVKKARAALRGRLAGMDIGAAVVRLILARRGDMACEVLPHPGADQGSKRLIVSPERTDPDDALLRHKTTRRRMYDKEHSQARAKGYLDALFTNTRGHITEGAITNIFILGEEGWKTPDISCGLLPGIWREKFTQATGALPCYLTVADLSTAANIVTGNSVRGTMEVCEVADSEGQVLYQKQDRAGQNKSAHPYCLT